MKRSTPKLTCPWLKEMIERFSELEEELRLLDHGQRGESYDVLAMFDLLNDQERTVVALRFCTMAGPILTQREIGERMGVSATRVSQIERRAMRVLDRKRSLNAFRRIVPWQHPSHEVLSEQAELCRRRRREWEEGRKKHKEAMKKRAWSDMMKEKAELLRARAQLIEEWEEFIA